jgi:hypothetical protein
MILIVQQLDIQVVREENNNEDEGGMLHQPQAAHCQGNDTSMQEIMKEEML